MFLRLDNHDHKIETLQFNAPIPKADIHRNLPSLDNTIGNE